MAVSSWVVVKCDTLQKNRPLISIYQSGVLAQVVIGIKQTGLHQNCFCWESETTNLKAVFWKKKKKSFI